MNLIRVCQVDFEGFFSFDRNFATKRIVQVKMGA